MRNFIVGALSAVLLLGGVVAADAGSVKVVVNAPIVVPPRHAAAPAVPVVVAPQSTVFAPSSTVFARGSTVVAPFANVFVAPRSVFVAPAPIAYLAPSGCWVPGYSTYQWVPQAYSYSVWVDGQWSPDGSWIDGHDEQRLYSTGYYQQLWIGGHWGC